MLSGDERCAVCGRRIVHADDHLRVPAPQRVDVHRLCVPDWAGYDAALTALMAADAIDAQSWRRRLIIALRDSREIPPVP